jgi:hypothetical protein
VISENFRKFPIAADRLNPAQPRSIDAAGGCASLAQDRLNGDRKSEYQPRKEAVSPGLIGICVIPNAPLQLVPFSFMM